MPIFEYECQSCKHEFTALILKPSEAEELKCPACGAKRIKKLMSRCAFHLSESDRLSSYDTSKKPGMEFYKDSRNIGSHAQKMAKNMGVDLGDQFNETLEKARTGKILDDYEK